MGVRENRRASACHIPASSKERDDQIMIQSHQYRSEYNGGPCTYKWHLTPCGRPMKDHETVDYKTKADQNMKKTVILVCVDPPGAAKMIEHVLDGSLKEFHPSVTVG